MFDNTTAPPIILYRINNYLHLGELMPTTVRAAGVGSSSLVSKVGGTLSTTVAALADIHPAIPTLIFTVMAITSGALTMFLPETKDRKMPDSLDDVNRCVKTEIFQVLIFLLCETINFFVGKSCVQIMKRRLQHGSGN